MKKYNNNSFRMQDVGKKVTLYGWVAKIRNLGGLFFLDLRDCSGIMQVVVRPGTESYKQAEILKNESVIEVTGIIQERESKNSHLKTGDVELEVTQLVILNLACDIPFQISDDTTALEDTRLKYRYLDLRRNPLKNNLILRSQIMNIIRNYFNDLHFTEVETPVLCKSTPEGARDYLVPSRVNKGSFYALPQSPQLFKQLLMIGGLERYYQITKCFRDEDLRADRQPEFTQVDMEMSFVDQNDVMDVTEHLIAQIFKTVKGVDIELPLLKMKYDDAINLYGSDKPDLRFDMPILDITSIFNNTEFMLFKKVIEENGIINCLVVKNHASRYSRKDLDKLTEFVKTYKAKGLAYLKFMDNELSGSIIKGLTTEELVALKTTLQLEDNDLVLIVADTKNIVKTSLGALRLKLGKELGLMDPKKYKLLWVVDFPVFEWSEEENRYMACHHPFTAPHDEDIEKLLTKPGSCYAKAYDIVINGYEVGGGSIRIHNPEVQKIMFQALGFTEEEAQAKFGWFIQAFQFGAPPHGGLALGLDRLTMLLAETENIRDVIAFPKTASATDLMSEAPDVVKENQLQELGIEIKG